MGDPDFSQMGDYRFLHITPEYAADVFPGIAERSRQLFERYIFVVMILQIDGDLLGYRVASLRSRGFEERSVF